MPAVVPVSAVVPVVLVVLVSAVMPVVGPVSPVEVEVVVEAEVVEAEVVEAEVVDGPVLAVASLAEPGPPGRQVPRFAGASVPARWGAAAVPQV